jgi:chromosomal replication initiation ATPase DnaA
MQGTDISPVKEMGARNAPCHAGMAQAIVAYAYDITLDEMLAVTRRGPKPALARQVAMYLSHIVLEMGVTEIGEAFERHRSTVSHALHHVEDLRDDAEFDRTLDYLEATLRRAAGGVA